MKTIGQTEINLFKFLLLIVGVLSTGIFAWANLNNSLQNDVLDLAEYKVEQKEVQVTAEEKTDQIFAMTKIMYESLLAEGIIQPKY